MERNNKKVIFTRILIVILLAWIYPYFNKERVLGTYLDNTYNNNKTSDIGNERSLAKNEFPKKRENKDLTGPLSFQKENVILKNKSDNITMNRKIEGCRINGNTFSNKKSKAPLSDHNGNMILKNEARNIELNKKVEGCRKNNIPHNDKGLKGFLYYNKDNAELKNEAVDIPLNKKDERCRVNNISCHNKNLEATLSCNREDIMLKNNSKNISTSKEVEKYAKSSLLCDNKCLNETKTKYKILKEIDYYFEKKIFIQLEKLYKHQEHDNITIQNSKKRLYRMKCICSFLAPVILIVGAINYIFFGPNPGSAGGQETMGRVDPLYAIPCIAVLVIYLAIVIYIIIKAVKYKRLKITMRKIK
ncbi:Plasmodium exported protein, unknown function [Plasmodium gonderi]|uniref:Variable surface protein n=1 Tax=Plasmodium gonderi TaxID=77519 RepID=A0A1Y1JT30_PLAGO|nr:Plasmodium exported protein, unknown function [Plasmodium gonderi]GAW84297.1 Plasmodium exported protein, unknown function [Plasmodium gonderi]